MPEIPRSRHKTAPQNRAWRAAEPRQTAHRLFRYSGSLARILRRGPFAEDNLGYSSIYTYRRKRRKKHGREYKFEPLPEPACFQLAPRSFHAMEQTLVDLTPVSDPCPRPLALALDPSPPAGKIDFKRASMTPV